MSDVWVVSSGQYSDYSIDFACESEAAAREMAAAMNVLDPTSDEFFAESFPVVTETPRRGVVLCAEATVNPAGEVVNRRQWTYLYWSHRESVPPVAVQREPTLESGVQCTWIQARGTDHERVLRTIGEQVALYVSELQ